MERRVRAELTVASFSGPLPHPSTLAQYNDIIPNGAERIMVMVEKQSAHREGLEKRVVNGNTFNQTLGSVFAFTITMTALICGTWLIHGGKSAEGLASIIVAVGGILGVFFYSKHEQRKERENKARNMDAHRKR